jgi:hypothetical protein
MTDYRTIAMQWVTEIEQRNSRTKADHGSGWDDHASDEEKDRDALLTEVRRLTGENTTALNHVRRLCAQRDTVARAVRSPNLTDEQKFAEIREAFAIVDGQRGADL